MAAKGGIVVAEEEKFFTSGETAKLLGVSQDTLSRWGKKGTFMPHHVLPNGYRFYSEEQINDFLVSCGKKSLVTTSKKSKSTKPKIKDSDLGKPLFKLYVDGNTGKVWVNYYAMRSGKPNAFAFANSAKLFDRVTEFVGGQEILSENEEYQLVEPMHNVTITLDSDYLNSVSATIAKGVFWIQLAFTSKLGQNEPSNELIDEARYMRWKIDDYMQYCGLKDRSRAIENIRKTLTILSHAEIQWQEYVVVRDDNGKPVYTSNYRDKQGRFIRKVKKALHTYRGTFITTRDIEPVHGAFEYWINKEFATYLAHAGVIAVHENFFRLKGQKNSNAITLAAKIFEYYGMNKGTKQATKISVRALFNAMPLIPKYEDLTLERIVTTEEGVTKKYVKRGSRGGWRTRILKPFEDALNAIVEIGIIKKWYYRDGSAFDNYEDFASQMVCFEPAVLITERKE